MTGIGRVMVFHSQRRGGKVFGAGAGPVVVTYDIHLDPAQVGRAAPVGRE